MAKKKHVSTTAIIHAAIYMSSKRIVNADGTEEDLSPFPLLDTTPKDVGSRGQKTKLVFWFQDTPELKRTMIAYVNGNLLVDPNTFYNKWNELRDMTLNKSYAGDDRPKE